MIWLVKWREWRNGRMFRSSMSEVVRVMCSGCKRRPQGARTALLCARISLREGLAKLRSWYPSQSEPPEKMSEQEVVRN